MPVDVASYMGGRTDERYYGKANKTDKSKTSCF